LGDGETKMLWWEWLYVPLYLLQAVSLFGFVYLRCIASATIWKTLFVVSVGYEIWDAYDMATNWFSSATPVFVTVVFTVVYLIQAPLWYGNFLYAFRCKEL
jgi:membrane protein YdbS with pleckstrin-like domain